MSTTKVREIAQRVLSALPKAPATPSHFHDVMFALSEARSAFPALRIGQLLQNVLTTELAGHDLFYVTNEDLANAIIRFIEKH